MLGTLARVAVVTSLVVVMLPGAIPRAHALESSTRTFELGPVTLDAHMTGRWQVEGRLPAPRPEGAGYVRGLRFDLVDDDGEPIPRDEAHLHHIVLENTARNDRLCEGRAERFGGTGSERTPMRLPAGYGYPVASGDEWMANLHVMNMASHPQTLKVVYEVDWVKTERPWELVLPVSPYFIDVTGCGNHSEYDIPAGSGTNGVHTETAIFRPPRFGIAVHAYGHQHTGGIDLVLRNKLFGTVVCGSAGEHRMGILWSMGSCSMRELMWEGAPYELTSRYDDSEDRAGAMGIMMLYVWD